MSYIETVAKVLANSSSKCNTKRTKAPRGGSKDLNDYLRVMKKKYNHLSQEQGYTIDRLLKQGKSQSEIAKIIGVHRSTVSREIARNKTAS